MTSIHSPSCTLHHSVLLNSFRPIHEKYQTQFSAHRASSPGHSYHRPLCGDSGNEVSTSPTTEEVTGLTDVTCDVHEVDIEDGGVYVGEYEEVCVDRSSPVVWWRPW